MNIHVNAIANRLSLRQPQRAALDAAVRHVERLPEKERLLVLAWKAHEDGKDDEANAIYRKANARNRAEVLSHIMDTLIDKPLLAPDAEAGARRAAT